MEKCGKVLRRDHAVIARQKGQDGVYAISATSTAREMRACSACAGDYEDPDRMAWTPDNEEVEERNGAACGGTEEEFPAEE